MNDNLPADDQASMMRDPRKVDIEYKLFPEFEIWAATEVDSARWDRHVGDLPAKDQYTPELLHRAREIVKRAAAIDTGALEGLYDVEDGFTITVATQAAYWEATLAAKGERARALIESQLNAYDQVLDLANQGTPITEAWIREIHRSLCENQGTYKAWTDLGFQDQLLPLGEYKSHPNHVLQPDGEWHAYAPVDETPREMHRLCENLQSDEFSSAHPVLQASFAHYALVTIHPFADGNGRVARALSSVFTYRHLSVPVLILAEHRRDYLAALRSTDHGNHQMFVNFIAERVFGAISLVNTSLQAARYPLPEDASNKLARVFTTKGGYTHAEVDQAGYDFQELIRREVQLQAKELPSSNFWRLEAKYSNLHYEPLLESHRVPVKGGRRTLAFTFLSIAPGNAKHTQLFSVEVPKDSDLDDTIRVWDKENPSMLFEARISDINPIPTTTLKLRLPMIAKMILGVGINAIVERADENLKGMGY